MSEPSYQNNAAAAADAANHQRDHIDQHAPPPGAPKKGATPNPHTLPPPGHPVIVELFP